MVQLLRRLRACLERGLDLTSPDFAMKRRIKEVGQAPATAQLTLGVFQELYIHRHRGQA
jgi:hypothetical protein